MLAAINVTKTGVW